uniref:Uncharacterized protein n=1 Tax=Nelumbo nucifera TaxID=4432 RepID=A0A822XQ41_NELNU|nr:TPA_asm: hypothetical protein HUJ06_022308 [Nelumbo nucifera]
MGWVGVLTCMNDYGKKHFKSLYWRTRAAMKKVIKNDGKQRLAFHYDPSSYALNFDDGCCNSREDINAVQQKQSEEPPASRNSTWVYVLWVKSY